MSAPRLILGTRGSPLALAQTRLACSALATACPQHLISIQEVQTTGDRRQDLSLTHLSPGGHGYETTGDARPSERVDPGLFTKELETALLAGRIDVAVHSLKDLPTVLPAGLKLAAVLPRADTADVIIYKVGQGQICPPPAAAPLFHLGPGALIATSSLRRQRQLLHYRPDLRVSDVRGNVGTRLAKLRDQADWTGLVLARAGMERLGFGAAVVAGAIETEHGRFAVEVLGPAVMLPAVGQGAIGLQARADDAGTLAALSSVNHAPTWAAVTVERELLALLGGGCQMPLGVCTAFDDAEGTLHLRAVLFGAEDAPPRFAEANGSVHNLRDVAAQCAEALRL
jgi:hydroxymethylbilane synthase